MSRKGTRNCGVKKFVEWKLERGYNQIRLLIMGSALQAGRIPKARSLPEGSRSQSSRQKKRAEPARNGPEGTPNTSTVSERYPFNSRTVTLPLSRAWQKEKRNGSLTEHHTGFIPPQAA